MKLNIGIIANSLPFQPKVMCFQPDLPLVLIDVRLMLPKDGIYSDDIVYFAEWQELARLNTAPPAFVICAGGGETAAGFMKKHGITGIIIEDAAPLVTFGVIQSIFLRFNQLENDMKDALLLKDPTWKILDCCSEFFQNSAVLFDSDFSLIECSTNCTSDARNPNLLETLHNKKKSDEIFHQARKKNVTNGSFIEPASEMVEVGADFPRYIINSFYDNTRCVASLIIIEDNKTLSACHLKLLEYISKMIAPSLSERYAVRFSSLENLRAVFFTILNKVNIDPRVVTKCLSPWRMTDDYRLIMIDLPEEFRNPDMMARCLYLYENIFPESVAVKHLDGIVLIVHNDTDELIAEYLPKLEALLSQHDAVCGISLPFNTIYQINIQYINTEMAILLDDKSKRVHFLSDIITNYLINKIAKDMPLIPLCHREALRIFDYDNANGSKFLLTLETYLRQNKSLQAAADELYIHRSTLAYRLRCIGNLAKFNYDDSKERLHILLSCIVLRNLGNEHYGR